VDYFIGNIKKYAAFTGRARRKEYWMYSLFYTIFYVLLMVIDAVLGTGVLSGIYALALLIPCISIATRRLHDTGRSGWWQLIVLIPIVGAIILLVFLVQDSHAANSYGQNPKSPI
jgi:uncharacterized membrane protein YhaH (DUF805 family)